MQPEERKTFLSGGSPRFLNICAALGIIALIVYVLIVARPLLLPLAVAMVVWYLVISLKRNYETLGRWGMPMPSWVAMTLAVFSVLLLVYLFYVLVSTSVADLITAAPRYQTRFNQLVTDVTHLLGVKSDDAFQQLLNKISIPNLVSRVAGAVTSLASDVGLILVYVMFLLLEYRMFSVKIEACARNDEQRTNIRALLTEIGTDINTYMRIKTWLSILTGVLSYIVMAAVGLDFAAFWAVLIFLLNYIPTVGSILGVLFPAVLMVVQFENWPLIIAVVAVLFAIQIVVGNVLEPRMMGKSLNLSSFVIILSLTLWASIWGVVGAFLCVPIMVILTIILAKFRATRPVAILLSANGRVGASWQPRSEADESQA